MTESPVYDQVRDEYLRLSKNPAWKMAFEIALGEWMRDIAVYHQGPIQAIVDRAVIRQLDKTRDTITKNFLLARLEEIRKERIFDERDVQRDKGGRFTFEHGGGRGNDLGGAGRSIGEQMAANLGTNHRGQNARAVYEHRRERLAAAETREEEQAATRVTRRDALGAVVHPLKLRSGTSPADHKADVLREAAEMTYLLQEKTLKTGDKQRIQYTISGPDGSRIETPSAGYIPDGINWEGGERIQFMAPIGADNPASVAGKVMDIGLVAGLDDERAAKAGSVVADIHDSLNTTSWGQRLTNVANAARVVSSNSTPLQQAHSVAQLAQVLGPDAARAFGPKMRQLTYRYSGQEALPEQFSEVARGGKQKDSRGVEESTEAFEQRLALDLVRELPSATEYKAALQAGSTPPSKGYLLDKDGKVISESVGFADDWYTPFNLKRLPKLKNGSYVRSRGYGGVTTEDISLAMHSGAQRVTVVSNSGVFTIEFDNRAKQPGHRFGFGGAAMQRRYAKSLDAIKNEQVDGSEGKLKLDQKGYAVALKDLKNKYPYFVKSVSVKNPVNAAATPSGESVAGTPERFTVDQGYVRPLSIKATGAKAGYADPAVAGERKPYDQLEAYQLRKTQFAELQRTSAARGSGDTGTQATSGGGIAGATSVAGDPVAQRKAFEAAQRREREAAGEGKSVSAYAKENTLSPDEAGKELAILREVVRQDAKGASDQEDVNTLIQVLADPSPARADWIGVRTQYQEDADFRKRVHDELAEVYSEHPKTGQLLPGLANRRAEPQTSDVDADAPDDMAALDEDGDYEPWMTIPKATIDSSPAIQQWRQQMAVQAADNPRIRLQKEFFNRYIDIQETDSRNRSKAAYEALAPDEKFAYDEMHARVIQRLNAERAGFSDDFDEERPAADTPARPAERREQSTGPMGESRSFVSQVSEILHADDEREASAFGSDMVLATMEDESLAPDETEAVVRRMIEKFDEQEAELRRMGHEPMAAKMAAAVDGMREAAEQWLDFE